MQSASGSYIGSVWFRKPWTKVASGELQQCLKTSIVRRQVNVMPLDLAGEIDSATAGDQQMKQGEDHDSVIITGVARDSQPPIAFRLKLQLGSTSNYYYFDRIGRASGSDTFSPVGAWDEEKPMQVWQTLDQVADGIQKCLYRYASNSPVPGNDIVEHQPALDATGDLKLPLEGERMETPDNPPSGGMAPGQQHNSGYQLDDPINP
ncbi:hypothetical protein BH688_04015 [Kushneria phosphatilytica]|nr:hypothetical protein BH688_04015 [Kushneria phosphatilytica]